MKPHILCTLLALALVSCVSENEQKGLDYIGSLYDAKTSYSKSFDSELGSETIKKFNIKVSESMRIDSLQPTVTTANIAWLMYESFSEDEKKSYTHVDVELVSTKNDTASFYYPLDVLEKLSTKATNFKAFSQNLVDGDFVKIDALKDEVEIPATVAVGLKNQIAMMEKKWGQLISYEPFGISEGKDEQGTIYQFQGYLVFEKGVYKPYLTVLDAAQGKDKLIGFKIFE